METLTPKKIVEELDKYIVGQDRAKRAVAIAMRNRWRRQQLSEEMREEIYPKNIIMIGPTGVGKTEIARRLSRLTNSPFVKVEATKYTEVGYVGRDVESIIRDLTEIGVKMTKSEHQALVQDKAMALAEERLLDLLIPPRPKPPADNISTTYGLTVDETREKFRAKLRAGELEDRYVELETQTAMIGGIEIFSSAGLEEVGMQIREMIPNLFPKKTKKKKVKVKEAREILIQEEAQKLIDMDRVIAEAIQRVEQSGMVFIDELDKVAGRESGHGPDVSREGVQRDLLPIVEGTTVITKYGPVRTDHILFIAAGAFHVSKPSDLIPELQGRFPIRVELKPLGEEEFIKILTEPKNALLKQYVQLLSTEGVELEFTEDAVKEIAAIAALVNQTSENIGARRLYTVMEYLLDDISFNASDYKGQKIIVDGEYVREKLKNVAEDRDLSKYIL